MASTTPSKGVYVETDESFVAQRVVEGDAPERGYQLIAPGVIPTPDDEARVKAARDDIAAAQKAARAARSGEPAEVADSAVNAEPTPVKAPSRGRS